MREVVKPTFYARIVIKDIVVKDAKYKNIPLQGRASKRYDNIGFY